MVETQISDNHNQCGDGKKDTTLTSIDEPPGTSERSTKAVLDRTCQKDENYICPLPYSLPRASQEPK